MDGAPNADQPHPPAAVAIPLARAHIRVEGRVQGVFFRDSLRRVAQARGVGGWVVNTADGAVEAVLEGRRADVEALAAWCRHGPPHARVVGVTIEWFEASGPHQDFTIRD